MEERRESRIVVIWEFRQFLSSTPKSAIAELGLTSRTMIEQKNKGAANLRSLLRGLYPPPGTSPSRCLLVERVERQDARFSE